jgi:biotin transport system substrate-specific component
LQIRSQTLADVAIPWSGVFSRPLVKDAILIIGFSILTAVFAQIAISLPFTTVPITGQTFAVLLTGAALGSRRGAASMGLYMAWGLIGIPVFAPAGGAHFIFPWVGTANLVWNITSGGYIVGFIFAAYFVGMLAERNWDRGWKVNIAMLGGNVLVYIFGLAWLAYAIGSHALDSTLGFNLSEVIPGDNTLEKTLVGGFYPFVVGDLIKLLLAGMVLPGAWEIVNLIKKRNIREK